MKLFKFLRSFKDIDSIYIDTIPPSLSSIEIGKKNINGYINTRNFDIQVAVFDSIYIDSNGDSLPVPIRGAGVDSVFLFYRYNREKFSVLQFFA